MGDAQINRRKFLSLTGKAAVLGSAISLLHLKTAYAEQAVDCPIYLFHISANSSIERVIRANINEGHAQIFLGLAQSRAGGKYRI